MLNDDKILELLNEYETNKRKLDSMVQKLEKLSNDIDMLIPKEYSPRTRFILEDRVKLITQLYDSILRYRTELAKQVEKQVSLIKEAKVDEEDLSVRISAMNPEETKTILKQVLHMDHNKSEEQ